MFLSNPAKSFLLSLLVLVSTTGCGLFGSSENATAPTAEGPKSSIPFRIKEPDNYQCEIVETAGEVVRRKRLAKKGNWRRIDFDFGEPDQRALLQTDKEYIIDIGRGVYAESAPGAGVQFSELTHELVSVGQRAEFEETGREGSVISYVVRPAYGSANEIVIRYDQSIGLPVKQEFFSTEGGERTILFTVEMINFRAEPETDAFSIPNGYRKIPIGDFLKTSNK
jgi:hypothetical protein